MFKQLFVVSLIVLSSHLQAQTEFQNPEIEALKKRVQELEEVQRESSEIQKRQLADQHIDQNSRGYIELKAGISMFDPDDIEDMNERSFNSATDSNWKDFGHAKIFDFEIGKTIYFNNLMKHEIGFGYQLLSSKMDGYYVDGGSKVKVYEKVTAHTLFVRYAGLFQASSNGKVFIGPGVTLGYSPVTKLQIDIEEGNVGEQATADSTSVLVELFGKAKIEFSRYFSFVAMAGYRMQEAKNLRVNGSGVATLRTNLDLDASGFFGLAGLAVAF